MCETCSQVLHPATLLAGHKEAEHRSETEVQLENISVRDPKLALTELEDLKQEKKVKIFYHERNESDEFEILIKCE